MCRARLQLVAEVVAACDCPVAARSSTPDQVAERIALLEKVYGNLQMANDKQYRVRRIGENIEQFEKRVSQVVSAIDASLSAFPPGMAVKELHSRLVEAGKAETQRDELETENRKDETVISNCVSKSQIASNTLSKLKELAKCDDDHQLEATITAAEKKSRKTRRI